MSRSRSLEIWHIPKRKNIHQVIGAVEILSDVSFNGKSWTSMKQESFNTKLGQMGLTNSGRPLSPSGRRTLEALIKYLGFIYVDNLTTPPTMNVTSAGFDLIRKHKSVLNLRKNLKLATSNKEEIIYSDVVCNQLIKLQITNPTMKEDCINILLFPFRTTLEILTKVNHLTINELGYIVFSMKNYDELQLTVEKIKSFRALPKERQELEIEYFKNTEIGNLTLVQAPTAQYYSGLCVGSGLCEKRNDNLLIKQSCLSEVETIIKDHMFIKPYNFDDNIKLWFEYYGNIERLFPPISVEITLTQTASIYLRITSLDGVDINSDVISADHPILYLPFFKKEKYKFEFYSFTDGGKIYEEIIEINSEKINFNIPAIESNNYVLSLDLIINQIKELISVKGYDSELNNHIDIISRITGKTNFNTGQIRGGRLEYLFYKLLCALKNLNGIDDVIWNGKVNNFGIPYPAPGGKEGNPDIYFFVGKKVYVLELTTIRAQAMQWSAEGASVHDHIMNLDKKLNSQYKIIGIFSAPLIADRVRTMFGHITEKEGIPHIPISIDSLIDILKNNRLNEIDI
jgi:hypothetical protein